MSSRLDEKRRLRLQREERQRERDAESRRNRRLKLLGAVLVAAAALVVIAIVASTSGGGGGSKNGRITGGGEVNARFAGIPQNGLTIGNPNAPVTFVEFADLKCPVCREYSLSAFPTLLNRYVRTGKVKMVLQLQHFVGNQNNDSERAARMALAASEQNKMWQFSDLFYINQKNENDTYVNDVFLRNIASQVRGLDVDKAFAARNSEAITSQLAQASAQFNTAGFHGTPSFAVGRSGGTLTPINYKSFDVSEFSGPIEKALGSSGS
jgi:protein-disulfide isomerase